ncbi:MAG: threonylcarbamoyl-AMP synthase [Bacteroidales bacterium]|nr:threonylcarbamoyl-AMP synthase [Bacteroidales bacterium]
MDTKIAIDEAVAVLKAGGVILYPTDTVWGLGCDATNEEAVAKVFEIKKRSGAKSLVLLAADLDMVARYIKEIPSIAIDLVEVNDAPMTIVYPGAQYLAPNVVAEDGSVGIRIPMNDFCQALIRRFRKPIVSTSANISGEPTPSRFDEISDVIKGAVDWCAPGNIGGEATGKASQIIKIGLKGEVEIIRA